MDGVDVVLSDIWGVVHNGLESFPEACEALHTFRTQGGTVILITNAPRPADSVQRQLRKLGVADDTYDAHRHFRRPDPASTSPTIPAEKMFWLGPERDNSIYRGLDPVLAPLEQADYIVCTGLFDDETETAEDYRAMMMQARERKLPLICANPDIVVERGDRLIYCAGAIAELYRELGGEVIFYGKPHRPIYERAMALAAERRGKATPLDRVLAIGDSVRTDLAGAHGFGIDLPVRDPRHPCRGIRGHRSARSGLGEGAVRPSAARADAGIEVVATQAVRMLRLRRPRLRDAETAMSMSVGYAYARRHVREDRLDLGLQRRGIERLDDVVVHAGLLGGDHVLGLGFRRDHDERRHGEVGIGADFPQQVVAGHRLHVPVGDHEPVFLAAHLVQRRRTVAGIVDILEAKLLQKISDDADHGVVVVHHQNRHRQINRHLELPCTHILCAPKTVKSPPERAIPRQNPAFAGLHSRVRRHD